MDDRLVLDTTKTWLFGLICQGNRVLANDRELRMPSSSAEEFFEWCETSKDAQRLRTVEEHFFVIAVNKTIEWLLETEKRSLIDRGLSKPFRKAAALGPQVRNMREHEMEYLQESPKRKKPESYDIQIPIKDNGVEALISAGGTVVTGEGILIGGRVNVHLVMDEAQKLYEQIEHIIIRPPEPE